MGTMTAVDDSLMRLQGLLIGIPDSEERLMRDAEERILQRIRAQVGIFSLTFQGCCSLWRTNRMRWI